MEINVSCELSNFRKFMIMSTCQSYIPPEFLEDESVFPERPSREGTMYVEAEDKVTLRTMGEITFVRVSEVLGVIYTSKSGRTRLRWRSSGEEGVGRLAGEVSTHSLINIFASGILDESYVKAIMAKAEER